jgi:hypothetical protein
MKSPKNKRTTRPLFNKFLNIKYRVTPGPKGAGSVGTCPNGCIRSPPSPPQQGWGGLFLKPPTEAPRTPLFNKVVGRWGSAASPRGRGPLKGGGGVP